MINQKPGTSFFTKFGQWSRKYSWKLIIAILILAVILFIAGITTFFVEEPQFRDILLDLAKGLGAIGTLLASISAYWKQIREKFNIIRLQSAEGHVVICGLGEKGMRLVNSFYDKGFQVVAIESRDEHPYISACLERGITVIIGDASDTLILQDANSSRARFLFALTDDDNTNIEITRSVHELIKQDLSNDSNSILRCFTHVAKSSLRNIFSYHALFDKTHKGFDASMFSTSDGASRYILEKYPPDLYASKLNYSQESISILVIGFEAMGESIVKQAVRIGHYIEWKKLVITILGQNIEDAKKKFFALYGTKDGSSPLIPGIEVRFINQDPETITSIEDFKSLANLSVIYITLDEESVSLSLSLRIRSMLPDDSIPIVICMKSIHSNLMNEFSFPSARNIQFFNYLEYACAFPVLLEDITDEIARSIHRSYVVSLIGYYPDDFSKLSNEMILENPSLVSWEDLTEDKKDSNRYQADHLSVKLRAIGYKDGEFDTLNISLENKGILKSISEMEHRRWCAVLLMDGWRYAPQKQDVLKKTHNCLVPYQKLPQSEKEKDKSMILNIKNLVTSSGWKKQNDFMEGKIQF